MPNPLSALLSSSGTAAKPDATPQEPRASKGAASFQMVMDQEADPQSAEPDLTGLLVQDPDTVSEVDDIAANVEIPDVSDTPEDQPPAELHAAVPEVVPAPVAKTLAEKPTMTSSTVEAETETVDETHPPPQKADRLQPATGPTRCAVSPAVQAMLFGTVSPRSTPQAATNPPSFPAGLVTPNMLPKEMLDHSPIIRPDLGGPSAPATPQVVQSQAVVPDRAPTLVQMQLLATDQTNTQTELQTFPEVEEISTTTETPTLSFARDSAPLTQTMTSTARAETARSVANQMATVVSTRGQQGTIEVALNPEELGRVSIVLNGRDDGLHIIISAERPETLDMMRRHISVLEAEFQNFGLGDLALDLGTSADAQQDRSDSGDGTRLAETQDEPVTEAGPAIPKLGPDGRIDMRL
ncbi:flagellar hook-length control protein FliK [Ruegeria arenilitoris]|uniref:flagellar hook-length control protein FliK n=1 Tax=Ruegeria arenilitoris TaxID=1173585 RepID=UPI00148139ED|nr:flagellar hook-length control protein FliK [Ruegeria arenilitoris]